MNERATTDESFDAEQAVEDYRRVIAQRDRQKTALGNAKIGAIVARTRQLWQRWQGEDSLHEMAFGEPDN